MHLRSLILLEKLCQLLHDRKATGLIRQILTFCSDVVVKLDLYLRIFNQTTAMSVQKMKFLNPLARWVYSGALLK
jgi:hypothetical protein